MNEALLTVGEASRFLKKSISTLRRWDVSGKLSSVRSSRLGYRRYRERDLIRFLEGGDFSLRLAVNSFIFDFDSTLICEESFCTIVRGILAGRKDCGKIQQVIDDCTNRAMNGEIDLSESLEQRLKLMKIRKKHLVDYALDVVSKITPGMRKVVRFLQDHGQKIFIMSGGMMDYVIPAADELGIPRENVFANTLFFDEKGGFLCLDMKNPLITTAGKSDVIRDLKENGMICGSVVIIGDGMSDVAPYLGKEADMFLGFGKYVIHPRVKEIAPYYFEDTDTLYRYLQSLF